MIPRGEVGLIFAGIGLTLMVDGRRILEEAVFSAILIMVRETVFVTSPAATAKEKRSGGCSIFIDVKWGEVVSVGLGNSANDLPLLREVDRPVVVRKPDRSWDSEVIWSLPRVARTDSIGPQGWREAIDKILDEATP